MDKSNLRGVILEYPSQMKLGQKFAEKINVSKKKSFSNLIICGMGGSALPGDLLASYFEHEGGFELPIHICRDYNLPRAASSDSLIFISSYSGNTEETLSCFNQALALKATLIAFSHGGEIKKISGEKGIPYVEYKINFTNFQPRYATTYSFAAMHQVLTNLELTAKISEFPKIDSRGAEVYGEELAKKIKCKIPIVYSSNKYQIFSKIWKIKLNENSKTPAFWNYFPELNHNEMVGFTNPQANFFVLMLLEKDDHERIQKRMKITAKLYEEKGVTSEIIHIQGETYLEKILNTLILGDWVSYYLALEYEQDPTPVEMVEMLKKKLN